MYRGSDVPRIAHLTFWLCLLALAHSGASTGTGRPTAWVHIGLHKTATTYIQEHLCHYRDALKAAGYVLPYLPGVCHANSFADLARSLQIISLNTTGLPEAKETVQQFEAALPPSTGQQHVIISSEVFSYFAEGGPAPLVAMLHNFDVKVVVFYRRKLSLLLSAYTQRTKNIMDVSMLSLSDYFVEQFINLTTNTRLLDFEKVLDVWSGAVGAGNVHVVSYEGLLEAQRDPANELLHSVIGVPPLEAPHMSKKRVNESPLGAKQLTTCAFLLRFMALHMNGTNASTMECLHAAGTELATQLPFECSQLPLLVVPWERRERKVLEESGAHLYRFGDEAQHTLLETGEETGGKGGLEFCEPNLRKISQEWKKFVPLLRVAGLRAAQTGGC